MFFLAWPTYYVHPDPFETLDIRMQYLWILSY